MGSLHLFLSCKTAAALASMLLLVCCLHLHSTLRREGEREEEREAARGVLSTLELAALLPCEGRMEIRLPPTRGDFLLKGRMEGGSQVVEAWARGELLLSSILPLPVGSGFFQELLSTPSRLLVIRLENLLLLERG